RTESSTFLASSSRPSSIASATASSISAIPDSDWSGPSCRNSAIRRRSSCSAVISCSARRACSASRVRRLLPPAKTSVDDRLAKRDRDGVRPGVRLELREDVPHVALHGLLADEELLRDVRVRHPVGEQLEDLALASGQHLLAGEEVRH